MHFQKSSHQWWENAWIETPNGPPNIRAERYPDRSDYIIYHSTGSIWTNLLRFLALDTAGLMLIQLIKELPQLSLVPPDS